MKDSRWSCIAAEYPQNVTDHRDTAHVLDLVLPLECGGCGAPSTRWCAACARQLAVKADEPHLVTPRVDPGVPVLSLGRYAGARREAIVAVKEHGRADLIAPLAVALQSGLERLLTWGVVGTPLTVVPAPTRRSAARRRGGDPVTRMARAATAGLPDVADIQSSRRCECGPWSATLSACPAPIASATSSAASRSIKPIEGLAKAVLVVDDIVTTGATASESVRVLQIAGAQVVGVLAIANA